VTPSKALPACIQRIATGLLHCGAIIVRPQGVGSLSTHSQVAGAGPTAQ